MIAHTPTIFASVALVALTMAFCLILAGELHRQDGMRVAGAGLLAHALAYVCYTLFGHAPLWLTYAVANAFLSLALAFYTAGILRINRRPVPWLPILGTPMLMALLLLILLDTQAPRKLAACVVLIAQCVAIVRLARRHAQPDGRAHLLLIIGGVVSVIGLLVRVAAIAMGTAEEMTYNVSNLKQTISVSIGTVTVMMMSLGLVLLARERAESALVRMALRDELTGIANRRAIMEQLEGEFGRARRAGTSLGVVLIDVDHFKRVNDAYGHLVGDEVLAFCAQHLRRHLRSSDGLGRYGGEEFLLYLPDTTPEGAVAAIDTLRSSLAETAVPAGELRLDVTFSAGIWCGIPGATQTLDKSIALADVALYRAKQAGRNTVRLAEASA